MPAESRYSYGTTLNRRSAGTPPAFTGAPPGHYRRRPGLNRRVSVALPGSDAGIVPVSSGGVTVYRGSAGTLPAFTGAPPGHYRRHPGLSRDSTGINRSLSGVDRDSAGLLNGFNRGYTGAAPGNSVTASKKSTNHPGSLRSTGVSKPGWTGALPAIVRLGLKVLLESNSENDQYDSLYSAVYCKGSTHLGNLLFNYLLMFRRIDTFKVLKQKTY
ncbi:hypothetical protein DPMN_053744 [Dreissena polymorpha]|uniref:Uncharacterized protein n=1 Tax=Dreissena polymorpha TaxID=45954 RepID=A0A9D4CND7_DREPO|nr:hypothetical protein DPMN_053744 [Dreissena polymorpha]